MLRQPHFGLTLNAWILLATAAAAQTSHTGVILGRVTDPSGLTLGGVRVTASSRALQGERTSVTTAHGDYVIPFLPPGDYKVTFARDGFQTLEMSRSLTVAETASLDVQLSLAGVVEAITVVSQTRDAFGQGAPAATTYRAEAIDKLPVGRDLRGAVLMAPGAASTGPSESLTIGGAMSSDGLYLVDGVVVNNVSVGREPRPLYIEDAIDETRTWTANISAEYGRFAGGVVTAVTKSGGNDFSGSLRATLNNERWRALTPFEKSNVAGDPRTDEIVPTWEATLGGPIFRDRLWFFAAGRTQEAPEVRTLAVTNIPYENVTDEARYEGKLTWSLGPDHTFRGAYTKIDADEKNRSFGAVMDRASLYSSEFPEGLVSLNYTGVLTPRLFLEAQFSRRKRDRVGVGSRFTDLIPGTVITDRSRNNSVWNSPIFCAVCGVPAGDLRRDHEWNRNVIVKASYFLSTSRLGSHSLVGGVDVFDEGRRNNQWQSGSGFAVFATGTIVRGEELFPVFTPDTTFISYRPIFERSQGGRYRTYSVFANDIWRLDDRFGFSLGLRWDKNDAKDQAGETVARDDAFSPRLAVSFDPKGDGDWTVNAGFARYVAAINNDIGEDGSAAGRPSQFNYDYRGPAINADVNAPNPVSADQALTTLFDWFFGNGGFDRPLRGTPFIPGLNRKVTEDGLIPPSSYEYTLGVAKRLGSNGLIRVDGVWRDFRDFYTLRADLATGKVTDSAGRVYDLQIITNSNAVDRNYGAVMIQTAYRFDERLLVNAGYTLSRTKGNFDGEERTEFGGAISNDTLLFYPEYGEARWRAPTGNLKIDQRHRARLWLNYDVPISPGIGLLDVALLERIESGQPFSSDGVIDSRLYVANPGYSTPPATVPYYFGGRGNFVTETVTATDLSINFERGLGKKAELFLRFIVLNVFDESAQVRPGDETVLTNSNDPRYAQFDPFTETPVRGVHWDLEPRFGEAVNADDYQTPRTFSFAAGFRF